MPTITIHLTTPIPHTFRAAQVAGMFDLPIDQLAERLAHTLTAEVPGLDEDWTIGAIVGPSGSGKTTLARAAYGEIYQPPPWPEEVPVIEGLESRSRRPGGTSMGGATSTGHSRFRRAGGTYKDLLRILTAVGLASPPSWLLPYRVLSTGERFRADLALAVLSKLQNLTQRRGGAEEDGRQQTLCAPAPLRETIPALVLDEFTSALDRTTACTASASLARFLRQSASADLKSEIRNLKFVALSCHTDFLPWLAPDWILDLGQSRPLTPSGAGRRGDVAAPTEPIQRQAATQVAHGVSDLLCPHWPRGSLRRPALRLAVRRVPQALWPRFARHHYLTGGLARSATCYAAFAEMRNAECEMRNEGNPTPHSALCIPHLPVAFCASLATLGHRRTKHISRLVVLPEFQGLGIGARLAETVAAHEAAGGNRVTITASHPAIVAWCWHSPRWKYTGLKKTGSTRQRLAGREIRSSLGRAVAAFEWRVEGGG